MCESIRRLEVKPGETVVVRLPMTATEDTLDEFCEVFKKNLPDGVRCLIVSDDIELTVVADGAVARP